MLPSLSGSHNEITCLCCQLTILISWYLIACSKLLYVFFPWRGGRCCCHGLNFNPITLKMAAINLRPCANYGANIYHEWEWNAEQRMRVDLLGMRCDASHLPLSVIRGEHTSCALFAKPRFQLVQPVSKRGLWPLAFRKPWRVPTPGGQAKTSFTTISLSGFFFSFYLQSAPVHSENCVNNI
jgi:hypothetical protein